MRHGHATCWFNGRSHMIQFIYCLIGNIAFVFATLLHPVMPLRWNNSTAYRNGFTYLRSLQIIICVICQSTRHIFTHPPTWCAQVMKQLTCYRHNGTVVDMEMEMMHLSPWRLTFVYYWDVFYRSFVHNCHWDLPGVPWPNILHCLAVYWVN